jgi:hypothetical protein
LTLILFFVLVLRGIPKTKLTQNSIRVLLFFIFGATLILFLKRFSIQNMSEDDYYQQEEAERDDINRSKSMELEVGFILSKRIQKISYEVPSTIKEDVKVKTKSFHPEEKQIQAKIKKKKKPVVSYIDNFTQKPYHLTKPKRVLIKDRDFLHLLGEVNGSKYDYCSRPELELFVIGVESKDYYQQIHYRDVIPDESASRPRSAHRPSSATKPEETKEKGNMAAVAEDQENPLDEPLKLSAHIIPHRTQNLFYDVKALEQKKTIALLYDPLKSLIIISEKMEIQLLQLLMETYMSQLTALAMASLPPEHPLRSNDNLLPSSREATPSKDRPSADEKEGRPSSSQKRQTKVGKGKGKSRESFLKGVSSGANTSDSDHSPRQARPSSAHRPSSAIKHRPTSASKSSVPLSAAVPPPSVNLQQILTSVNLKPENMENPLVLLQSYYYIGNQDVIYTMNFQKVQLWKRFYSTYLMYFFKMFLDAYSFQYSYLQTLLTERMNQIDQHIELNQNKTILEDSQSEGSEGSVEKFKKSAGVRKTKKLTTIKKRQSSFAVEKKERKASMVATSESEREETENEMGDNIPHEEIQNLAGFARRNNIKPIFIPKEDQKSKKTNLIAHKKGSISSFADEK